MAIKVGLGKWPEAAEVVEEFEYYTSESDMVLLPIAPEHARHSGLMPGPHRDPFDRMLAAQARIESLTLVSADPAFATLGVPTLW